MPINSLNMLKHIKIVSRSPIFCLKDEKKKDMLHISYTYTPMQVSIRKLIPYIKNTVFKNSYEFSKFT